MPESQYIAVKIKGVVVKDSKVIQFISRVIANMPTDWLTLTTHRLDIYEEELAKTQFLTEFEKVFEKEAPDSTALLGLPTAYDYIRLGHPLSSILEWVIAKSNKVPAQNLICFSSSTIAILAILRKNLIDHVLTRIICSDPLPEFFDADVLHTVYGYQFEIIQLSNFDPSKEYHGKTILVSNRELHVLTEMRPLVADIKEKIDFFVDIYKGLGSVLQIHGKENEEYISEIQHVRRRETVAMTPDSCLQALSALVGNNKMERIDSVTSNTAVVLESIKEITGASTEAIIGSSGLSIQYAILMGLIHNAIENHPGKAIKIIVPPNCYGGTNDQCRRVAACNDNIEVLDLAVDDGHDMVQSIDHILEKIAKEDAVPLIIAEIPTNPRVEVPDLEKLREVLSKTRKSSSGELAIPPVFILDQTFCPNVHFLGNHDILSSVQTISYVSGSKFPSGGLCTAGYCVSNQKAEVYMQKIERHVKICGNEATDLQLEILAKQMPSMNKRILEAYKNTREFSNFISLNLPKSNINFVSEDLASKGFTPSVFSLDLPTKGRNDEEKEANKRTLNHKLINMMITNIPHEAKHCVSYGQLSGSYWTIPATSTQGTTKEGDKDYIVRVALSPKMDLEHHKKVFLNFVASI